MKSEGMVVFSGKIGEVVHTQQPDGRVFERFRRPPGVRLIIVSPAGKILITKEQRAESGGLDYRLPGGKVCDSVAEYGALKRRGVALAEAAKLAAIKEALEETGLRVRNPQLIVRAVDGATVEWDLYYFKIVDYDESPGGQRLEAGEDIAVSWMTPAAVKKLIQAGLMQEWRTVGVLLAKVLG